MLFSLIIQTIFSLCVFTLNTIIHILYIYIQYKLYFRSSQPTTKLDRHWWIKTFETYLWNTQQCHNNNCYRYVLWLKIKFIKNGDNNEVIGLPTNINCWIFSKIINFSQLVSTKLYVQYNMAYSFKYFIVFDVFI